MLQIAFSGLNTPFKSFLRNKLQIPDKEETKKEPTSRSYPPHPPGGSTPAEQLTEVPPQAERSGAGGDLRQLRAGPPEGGRVARKGP